MWGVLYLPGRVCMSVVAEVVSDPLVDAGQSDFALFACLHGSKIRKAK